MQRRGSQRAYRNEPAFAANNTLAVIFYLYLMTVLQVACAIIRDPRQHVLVTQRSATMKLPLKWEFPGGKIEPNESAETCLIREIKEELLIDIKLINLLPSNRHEYETFSLDLIPYTAVIQPEP